MVRPLPFTKRSAMQGGNSARDSPPVWGRGAMIAHRSGGGVAAPPPLALSSILGFYKE